MSTRSSLLNRPLDRKTLTRILFWPVASLALLCALWQGTRSKLNEDYLHARQSALQQESLLARSYATQLRRTVDQIDQTTRNLKDEWEDPNISLSLEKKHTRALFPKTGLISASIVGPDGKILTSSLPDHGSPNLSAMPFFQVHKASCCVGLLISRPEPDLQSTHPSIHFSRRLENPDGGFGGVVLVSADPSYLASFLDEGSSPGDFVSVRLTSGAMLANRLGSSAGKVRRFYREDPVFPSFDGATEEPAWKFTDGKPRIVAWKKLKDYPMVAVAAISEEDAYAPYRRIEHSRVDMALLTSLFILLFGGAGMVFSVRLAWRRQREEQVRTTYRLATDAAKEGFYMIRPLYDRQGHAVDFQVEDCNQRGAALFGMAVEQLIGQRISSISAEDYREGVFALCGRALEHGSYEDEYRVTAPSRLRAAWVNRRMMRYGDGLALTIRDISDIKQHEQALSDLANSDALTQLPNRRWLGEFLPAAVERARQGSGSLAVLFIDLDNFKNINDTLGHEAGDELLQQAAARLKRAVRASDRVVRLGGDEFTIVLEHVELLDDVERIAKSVVRTLTEPCVLSTGAENQVNASVGISVYPEDGTDGETLLKHADIAMYAAKAAGKGRHHFYQSHLSDTLVLRLSKERALRQAVESDQFVVHYQPGVDTRDGRLSSVEALVRWEHPERGLVYPSEFIELAEDIGLIARIGELVIEKVCTQMGRWRDEGLQPVPVSINISPQQLKTGGVSAQIAHCLARHGLEPALLEAELTESAVIDRSQTVTGEVEQLRALGIKLMIDDFGTGYSSLAQLHRLDVDALKVDQAFTRALCEGSEGRLLFRAIISMADALEMGVVAEGVETVEQLDVLRALSCQEIQGYLVSRAVAAGEMSHLLLKRFLFPDSVSVAQHSLA